jgi:Putative peptidoglycan binding domain
MATLQAATEGEGMKIRRLMTLIVGITSVALSPLTFAGGHGGGAGGFGGGGGGFGGGGHFGGGGFHGGAFRGSGPVTGGASTRGGGVGFGGMRARGGSPNFEGAGPRFSSFGHPSHAERQVSGARAQASRPEVTRPSDQRFSSLRNHIAARHDASWHNDWDRRHVHFDHGRFFVFIDGFWCGLDDGFFPWDYLPYYPDDYYPYDYYTNTDPYDYNGTTYDPGSADSGTVQAVQAQLFNLGYYSGSIDGVFGPTTRDAVAKYQIANHLNVTGSLSPDTIQSLGLPQATPS